MTGFDRATSMDPSSRAAGGRTGGRVMARIMVVDGNAGALDAIRRSLQDDGHTVRCASSGRAALKVAASFCPDVTLVDYELADMTGVDVIRMMQLSGRVSCAIMAREGTITS